MSDNEVQEILSSDQKALTINLDSSKFGTFAEIGAGQETARIFFQVGGAAGTIAKTMSAYDMIFSNKIYGKSDRYVSRERVETMIKKEYGLLEERLSDKADEKSFFAFANTVKAKSYNGPNDAHGWLGIRIQFSPNSEPNEIVLHTCMSDSENVQQQHALGVLGTNLIYGAYFHHDDPEFLMKSLVDNVGSERVEIDFINFSGPNFEDVDNRIMNLKLVRHGLTNAVLFSPQGDIEQAAEVLYKKAILVERGSFRPVSKVNTDMLKCSGGQFIQEPQVQGKNIIVLAEITMNNLLAAGELDTRDFLDRIDSLGATGNYVLISNYFEFYRLTAYFRRYTKEMIGVAMGIANLMEVFNPKYYTHLEGGILENFGRLFRNSVKLYIYPMKQGAYHNYLKLMSGEFSKDTGKAEPVNTGGIADEILITCQNMRVENSLTHLYKHLLENDFIDHIKGIDESLLEIFSRNALEFISQGDPRWEEMVPSAAVKKIKEDNLFGYRAESGAD